MLFKTVCLHLFFLSATVAGGRENCQNPMGTDGSTHTEGCIRHTCKKGVWRSSLATGLCCYEGFPYQPGDTVVTTQEGCSQASIICQDQGNTPTLTIQVENMCEYASRGQVDQLIDMVKDYVDTNTKRCQEPTNTSGPTTPLPVTEKNAILVSGGWGGDQRSVEMFIPLHGKTCTLPDLPDDRNGHTMDVYTYADSEDYPSEPEVVYPMICGGGDGNTQSSCICFEDLGQPNDNLTQSHVDSIEETGGIWIDCSSYGDGVLRDGHNSWKSSKGLVLMGGVSSLRSTSHNFSLYQATRYACSIADTDSVILTGGRDSMRVVARYNLQGFVEYLPSMQEGRRYHGCGSYHNTDGQMVFLVTGGRGGYYSYSTSILASTELLTAGAAAWQTAEPLPRPMISMATVSMNNTVFVTGGGGGGRDDGYSRRSEILGFNGKHWELFGHLNVARNFHAATTVDVAEFARFCDSEDW